MSDAVPTRYQLGELALAWRRKVRAFDQLPFGTPERNAAFEEVAWAGEEFWRAVDRVLDSEVPGPPPATVSHG